jgi:chromate reductase, NAD(P)H dehydrogenase (quinone)
MYGKPVAWINVAAEGRGEKAHAALSTVLGYEGAATVEAAGRRIVVPRDAVGPDQLIEDASIQGPHHPRVGDLRG